MDTKLTAIPRYETFNGDVRPILFFPTVEANLGRIAYVSVEGHGEASLEYYYCDTFCASWGYDFSCLGYTMDELNLKHKIQKRSHHV